MYIWDMTLPYTSEAPGRILLHCFGHIPNSARFSPTIMYFCTEEPRNSTRNFSQARCLASSHHLHHTTPSQHNRHGGLASQELHPKLPPPASIPSPFPRAKPTAARHGEDMRDTETCGVRFGKVGGHHSSSSSCGLHRSRRDHHRVFRGGRRLVEVRPAMILRLGLMLAIVGSLGLATRAQGGGCGREQRAGRIDALEGGRISLSRFTQMMTSSAHVEVRCEITAFSVLFISRYYTIILLLILILY